MPKRPQCFENEIPQGIIDVIKNAPKISVNPPMSEEDREYYIASALKTPEGQKYLQDAINSAEFPKEDSSFKIPHSIWKALL